MFLVEMLRNPGQPFLAARELQNSIKDSVHKLLSDQVVLMGLTALFDIGDSYFRCKNGAYVIFKGLRTNANEIKSLEGVKIAWVEEAQKVSQGSWELLIPTIRSPGSEIWATYNPDEEDDAVHQMFVINEPPPNARVVQINWSDNPWFPQELEEERAFMHQNDPDAYDHVWNGNCKKFAGGSIYGKWLVEAEGRIVSVPYNPAFPVITSWDLGYADSTSIWFLQLIGKEPRLIDFYQSNLEAIDHYVKYLKSKPYMYEAHVLPHDAGHNSIRTNTTLKKQIEDMGLKDTVVLPVDAIESGIELVRQLIPQLWFDKEKCKDGLKALRAYQYEYDDDKQVFKNRPRHDWSSHCADSLRYMATYLARRKSPVLASPSKLPYSQNQPSSWMG